MKVRFIKGERITLTLYAKKQRKKTVEIHPNTLATNLSNLLPNPISITLLCQLPWIRDIVYRNNQYEVSLTYNLVYNGDGGNYSTIEIDELDEDIIRMFNQYCF